MELLAIQNLSFAYPERTERALDGVSLTVEAGEFLVLCGRSGSGKTTLLRQLKPSLAPHGTRSGEISFRGQALAALDRRSESREIGFVFQSPENQIVTDKVWHELAFGLESLGCETPVIRRRVAEMAAFFGIGDWFETDVAELSGGQKQLLNLAAVMTMQPALLLLDEPTGQLDPVAASEFLAMLSRLCRELGTTLILSEQRLEEAIPLADRVAVLDGGKLLCAGTPAEVGQRLRETDDGLFLSMPAAMRIWAAADTAAPCPVTVREGRDWLADFAAAHPLRPLPPEPSRPAYGGTLLSARELWFRYEKNGPDILKGVDLTLRRGELMAMLGGNGAGKTTLLRLLAGLEQPLRGSVERGGRVGLLPQDPKTLFAKKTVREELLAEGVEEDHAARTVALCRLTGLLDRHPYDLSGGEQQRLALAKVLLASPDVLLLDEPTKGLDAPYRRELAEILDGLLRQGKAVVMVSHDLAFCAAYAHRCALLFDGGVAAEGTPREFFAGNRFYTTPANRIARDIAPEAVTPEDVIAVCGGTLPPAPEPPEADATLPPPAADSPDWKPPIFPLWRKALIALTGLAAVVMFLWFIRLSDLTALIAAGGFADLTAAQIAVYGAFLADLIVFALAVTRRDGKRAQTPREKRRLTKRTVVATVLILLLIPLTLWAGWTLGRNYYLVSVLVLLECMAPFFLIFEGRRPQGRELVIIAALCALSVVGRAAFFMLPEFKPVLSVAILAGVAFGGETGFLVGALSMLLSNMLFAQGPWTPWQMFAMGIAGFLAGVLFRKGLLRRSRTALAMFGAIAAIVIYGGLINAAAALLSTYTISREILITYYVSGFPVDCVHAAATFLFLWFLAEPMLEKLDRIKTKYGLVE